MCDQKTDNCDDWEKFRFKIQRPLKAFYRTREVNLQFILGVFTPGLRLCPLSSVHGHRICKTRRSLWYSNQDVRRFRALHYKFFWRILALPWRLNRRPISFGIVDILCVKYFFSGPLKKKRISERFHWNLFDAAIWTIVGSLLKSLVLT